MQKTEKTNRKALKRVLLSVGIVILALIIGLSVYLVVLLHRTDYKPLGTISLVDDMESESEEIPSGVEEGDVDIDDYMTGPIRQEDHITNILLLGSDRRPKETYGRSDSMIILSLNKNDKTAKLISIPRDLYVYIPVRDVHEKITHSHAYGGPALSVKTVEQNFRIKIDKYVRIEFEGFKKIIDRIGGIDISLTNAEVQYLRKKSLNFSAGLQHLDGAAALAYSRIRHIDSALQRDTRQRDVLDAIMQQLKSKSIFELNSLLYELLPLVRTDWTSGDLVSLAFNANSYMSNGLGSNAYMEEGHYQSRIINKMFVWVADMKYSNKRLQEYIYGDYKG